MDMARRNMKSILKNGTVHYPLIGRRGAAKVHAAGVRRYRHHRRRRCARCFEVVGVHNVLAKCISNNAINVVRATMNGLVNMDDPESVAAGNAANR